MAVPKLTRAWHSPEIKSDGRRVSIGKVVMIVVDGVSELYSPFSHCTQEVEQSRESEGFDAVVSTKNGAMIIKDTPAEVSDGHLVRIWGYSGDTAVARGFSECWA